MSTPMSQLPPIGALRTFSDLEKAQIQQRLQSDSKLQALAGSLNTFLQASEYQLIQMMAANKIWAPPPSPVDPGGNGSLEFGLVDYWLNNLAPTSVQDFWKFIAGGLPATQMNATNLANLLTAVTPPNPGLVGNDGTIYGFAKYEQMDPNWTLCLSEYLAHYLLDDFADFGSTPAQINAGSGSQISIALFGDWGTGNYPTGPASSVMNAITELNPDYIIHLGDVYYAGTSDEEQSNLLNMWPGSYQGKSFTLNSNHEMYDGAHGYFETALANSIFSAQQQTSYFTINYDKWTILGLDSAYWSTSPLIMNGSISEAGSSEPGANAQPQFIQTLGLAPENVIVLTHHNAIEYDGSKIVSDEFGNDLWKQVTGALGGEPGSWYWGHVHNGIVYPNPTFTKNNSYYRCVGHGAIPFGNAWGLQQAPSTQVTAYADTPNPGASPIRVMNGFTLLTITARGQVTETFYDQDGKVTWVSPFTYQLGVQTQKAVAAGTSR